MIKIFHLLKVVDAYQSATGLADSTISNYVFNDGKLVKNLRSGRDITVSRFNDALRWFSAHWPEGTAWPEGITRPVVEGGGGAGASQEREQE